MIRFLTAFAVFLAVGLPSAAQIKIEEVTSQNGIKAWLVNEPAIPFIALQIGFEGGTSLDADGKAGATNLMMGLLEEGTGDMDATAFLKASEALAANFGFNAGRDLATVSAQVLTSNADEALALLRRALIAPAFNEVAFNRVKQQVISGLESDLQDPNTIAQQTLNALAFANHPYAVPSDGTIESVKALTRSDMIEAHARLLSKDHLVVGVVGDVTAAELGPMLDDLLGALPEQGAPLPPSVPFGAKGGVTVVDFPGPQSTVVWAQSGLRLQDDDFMPAYVMNHILGGGGFGSRLTDEVREKRGLTYGVYSYLAAMEFSEFYGGGVASANKTVAEAIDVIKAEWARMAAGGVTDIELERAKKNMTGSYPLRFDGNSKIARILVSMQSDEFPIDYANTRNERVNAVSKQDIARVAADLLDADALHFVVVGQPEGLTSQ